MRAAERSVQAALHSGLRSAGWSGEIRWPARFKVAGPGRRIQFLYDTDLTAEDYVERKAWWDASPPAECPYHPQGGCSLVSHGTYGRRFPHGARVRRFLCRPSGQTLSLLPKCLAAHWSGTDTRSSSCARPFRFGENPRSNAGAAYPWMRFMKASKRGTVNAAYPYRGL